MRLNEISFSDAVPVDGYGPGFFRIGGAVVEGAVLILPGGVTPWRGYDDTDLIRAAAAELDLFFVGTGAEAQPIPAAFRRAVEEAGLGLEMMPSPAACRTYNVLLAEGRRIGMGLLPV